MSRKKTLSKVGSATTTKKYRILAVEFHGEELQSVAKELAKHMEDDPRKFFLPVVVPDSAGLTPTDETKKLFQIVNGVDKCKKYFETISKTLTNNLEEELNEFWKIKRDKGEDSNPDDGLDDDKDEIERIFPRKLSDANMHVMFEKIQNSTPDICDYYIVLFGRFSTRVLIELQKTNKLPLQAIIHFIPCSKYNLKENFPELHNDIEFLKKSPDTKNIGIFDETLMRAEKYLDAQYSSQIYDQFTWYLYDIEMLIQQFAVYQTDFVEINDSLSVSQEHLLFLKSAKVQRRKETNDNTAVIMCIDDLCHMVDDSSKDTFLHPRPFLDNNHGRIIVEESNKLLQSAIASQMDMLSYWRLIDTIVSTPNEIPKCEENLESLQLSDAPYYELLSWEAFAQRFQEERILYDKCYHLDLAGNRKLYILRRTLNRVLEQKREFRLPTKLCFRDFCEYMIPQLLDTESQEKKGATLSGLTFEDTLQELSITDRLYRFEDGCIRCSLENWLNKGRQISIELRLFDCTVYTHRWESHPSKFRKLRILTKNSLACNIKMKDTPGGQDFSIQWPNDCHLQYINENGAQVVEQTYGHSAQKELKRLYTPQGCVILFLENETIEVLTPNGTIYMIHPKNYASRDSNGEQWHFQRSVELDIQKELDFIKGLGSYGIDCTHFEVTRSDGRKLRVLNGKVVEEQTHFLVYEWMDPCKNERYADRDDGVKMIWSCNDFKCFYPCGTVITTTVIEDSIAIDFEIRNKSTEDILRRINPTLPDKLGNKTHTRDTYVTYNVHYLMQHKNYASVAFCGDAKMLIQSPDGFKLNLKQPNLIQIDIEEKLRFCIASGMCTILSGASIPENKKMSLTLGLCPNIEKILAFQSSTAHLSLFENGQMILDERDDGTPVQKEEIYYLAEENRFAMAFLSNKNYRSVTTNFQEKSYFYDSPTKTVIFRPILPIDEQFVMNIPDMVTDLRKFQGAYQSLSKPDIEKLEHILSVRVISNLTNISNGICNFMENFQYTEKTLSENITEALEYFLGAKVKSKDSVAWRNKNVTIREDFKVRKQGMQLYNKIRRGLFPKYHEYRKCKGDLKLIDLQKIKI